ncbi:MAG: hypothetical protein ACHQEA_04830 [Gaiellales bacterium]
MRFRPALLATLCAAALLSATGAVGASAQTVPGTRLSLTNFGYVANDAAYSHVFITGGSSDSSIIVRNVDGSAVTTITGESGAGGMVVDNGTLYVARCGSALIDTFDTATLAKTGSIAAASISAPCDLALAGGRLWYATSDQFGYLASVPLDGSAAETLSNVRMHGATFATTPAHTDWLVVGDDSGASTVKVLDASTAPATPTVIVSKVGLSGTNSIRQLAISPDGGSLYLVGPASGTITSFALPNLDVPGPTYGFSDYPVGIAISPDGGTIAGGTWAPTNPDVSLFTVGGAAPTRTYQFGSTETLRDGGLLCTSDGTHIFAVTKDSLNGVLFHSLATGNLPAGTLTIKASAGTVTYGKSVTLTAHLGTASANRTVSIYRHAVSGGPDALVKTATVNSSGNLVVAVKPGMNMYYSAAWLGDATHDQTASSNVRVNVRLVMHISASGGYKTLSGYRLYHYTTACHASHRGCPTVVTYATPLQPGATVHMTLQQRVGRSWRTIASGDYLPSTGKLALTIVYSSRGVIGANQRISFSVKSDSLHVGAASPWAYFRVTT